MPSKKKSIGSQLIEAMQEAVAIERGAAKPARTRRVATARSSMVDKVPLYTSEKIVRVREAMDVSQPVFADVLNVSPNTVRAWEQGKRIPDGAAVRLLQVAEEHPAWLRSKVRTAPSGPRLSHVGESTIAVKRQKDGE